MSKPKTMVTSGHVKIHFRADRAPAHRGCWRHEQCLNSCCSLPSVFLFGVVRRETCWEGMEPEYPVQ